MVVAVVAVRPVQSAFAHVVDVPLVLYHFVSTLITVYVAVPDTLVAFHRVSCLASQGKPCGTGRFKSHGQRGRRVAEGGTASKAPRLYTRSGDDGSTGLVGGSRVPKDDLRIACYGTVDELNSVVGMVRAQRDASGPDPMDAHLEKVQHQLFDLGAALATPLDARPADDLVGPGEVAWLEARIDEATAAVPALTTFVLPGGGPRGATLHLARTVCRRAERLAVALHRDGACRAVDVHYLNRLSDALFAWARLASQESGHDEVLWRPGMGKASGSADNSQ